MPGRRLPFWKGSRLPSGSSEATSVTCFLLHSTQAWVSRRTVPFGKIVLMCGFLCCCCCCFPKAPNIFHPTLSHTEISRSSIIFLLGLVLKILYQSKWNGTSSLLQWPNLEIKNPRILTEHFVSDLFLLLLLAGYYAKKLYWLSYNHWLFHSSLATAEENHDREQVSLIKHSLFSRDM